mgnify:CR=1 FL=1
MSKLLGFDYEIQYKSGHDNVVADALSRVHGTYQLHEYPPLASAKCPSISYPYGGWLDDLRRNNEHDSWIAAKTRKVLESLDTGNSSLTLARFSLEIGFLCYKKRIVLSPDSEWRSRLLDKHHFTPAAPSKSGENIS